MFTINNLTFLVLLHAVAVRLVHVHVVHVWLLALGGRQEDHLEITLSLGSQ